MLKAFAFVENEELSMQELVGEEMSIKVRHFFKIYNLSFFLI